MAETPQRRRVVFTLHWSENVSLSRRRRNVISKRSASMAVITCVSSVVISDQVLFKGKGRPHADVREARASTKCDFEDDNSDHL